MEATKTQRSCLKIVPLYKQSSYHVALPCRLSTLFSCRVILHAEKDWNFPWVIYSKFMLLVPFTQLILKLDQCPLLCRALGAVGLYTLALTIHLSQISSRSESKWDFYRLFLLLWLPWSFFFSFTSLWERHVVWMLLKKLFDFVFLQV